jgi:hypothetical protein
VLAGALHHEGKAVTIHKDDPAAPDDMVLLAMKQCAALGNLHIGTLRQIIREGKGPPVTRVGRRDKIRRDQWRKWLRQLSDPAKQSSPDPAADH